MRTDEGWGLLEEWIGSFFCSYCCCGAVAGIDFCILGQREKLGLYACYELVEIAAGKVRSAYRACKKGITDKDDAFLF